MSFTERLRLADLATMGLSESPEDQYFLPKTLPCPQQHTATLHWVYQDGVQVPCYCCPQCTVVYRYAEMMGYESFPP